MGKNKVGIIGGGNWGTAIAKIIGNNLLQNPNSDFDSKRVTMYVYEETLDQTFGPDSGKKLTSVINSKHENVKYLKGHKLPENVVADSDVVSVVKGADYLIFVLPHQFIGKVLEQIAGKVKSSAVGISLVKGIYSPDQVSVDLLSNVMQQKLKIPIGVLMGANVATEVADGCFCETTIAFDDIKYGLSFKKLMETADFRVTVIKDVINTELCGALKNIVSTAAGFCIGCIGEVKTNTTAVILRLGLWEMIRFAEMFFPGGSRDTFLQSCGFADLITSTFGGRNRRVAEEFAKSPNRTLVDISKEMLQGQQLQGPDTAAVISAFLKSKGKELEFPLFMTVDKICKREMPPNKLIDSIRYHPEYSKARDTVTPAK